MTYRIELALFACVMSTFWITSTGSAEAIKAPSIIPQETWLSGTKPFNTNMKKHAEEEPKADKFIGVVIHHTETMHPL